MVRSEGLWSDQIKMGFQCFWSKWLEEDLNHRSLVLKVVTITTRPFDHAFGCGKESTFNYAIKSFPGLIGEIDDQADFMLNALPFHFKNRSFLITVIRKKKKIFPFFLLSNNLFDSDLSNTIRINQNYPHIAWMPFFPVIRPGTVELHPPVF